MTTYDEEEYADKIIIKSLVSGNMGGGGGGVRKGGKWVMGHE